MDEDDETHWSAGGSRTISASTDAYARYFVRFVQEYRRAGVPIDAVTLQNEPQNRNPSAYPGMDLRDGEEAWLVVAVGRALQRAGLHAKILGYDHNWALHPNDGARPTIRPTRSTRVAARQRRGAPLPGRVGVPLLFGGSREPIPAPRRVSRQGHLLHGVLGVPIGLSGDDLPGHPALAHPLPHRGRHPQLGQDGHHRQPRPDLRRTAQRRLRDVLRRRHGRSSHRPRHPHRRLLRPRPRHPLHPPGRGPHRLDRRGQRLERGLPHPDGWSCSSWSTTPGARRPALRRARRRHRALGTTCRRARWRPSCCRRGIADDVTGRPTRDRPRWSDALRRRPQRPGAPMQRPHLLEQAAEVVALREVAPAVDEEVQGRLVLNALDREVEGVPRPVRFLVPMVVPNRVAKARSPSSEAPLASRCRLSSCASCGMR